MQYQELGYVPESEDPSLTIETTELIAKVIDNVGLLAPPVASTSYLHLGGRVTPFVHHLGYHGLRTLYHKSEKRNLVIPFASWLNLQTATLEGIEPDPVDERAYAGIGRGWPMRLERVGAGTLLTLDPLPNMRMRYTLELQPAEPDGIDFHVRFEFGRRPEAGPARFRATWPCYINGYDDVRLFYPRSCAETGTPGAWQWASIGEKPDILLGEAVGYRHDQQAYRVADQAFPLGYGHIGQHVLILMFSDPEVQLFVVNAGGHFAHSSVQNPAWDFEWCLDDYPLQQPIGFSGRLIYTRFESPDQVLSRYRQWKTHA